MTVSRVAYHGWSHCHLITNGIVEAVVVPAIGRVMQFRLAGELEGVFWDNRELDGRLHGGTEDKWINFGGDKCWPAPQSSWTDWQGRDWPPPAAFDSSPMTATFDGNGVVLTSSVDPGLGIQVSRRIALDSLRPVMRIRTEFRKIHGPPAKVAVWTISQLRECERVAMLLPEESRIPGGYTRLMKGEPENLRFEGRVLSLERNPRANVKIGTDASSLAWIGAGFVVRMDVERLKGEYPDGGCITEVYTNRDPLAYVELETLGPLSEMHVGDCIELTTAYTLTPRLEADLDAEVRRVFSADPADTTRDSR